MGGPDFYSARFFFAVIALNITLSAIHKFAEYLRIQSGGKWGGGWFFSLTDYLLTIVEWVMGARRRKDE